MMMSASDTFSAVDEEPTTLLQNLSGPNSLIGRSVTYSIGGEIQGCCVIALDMAPMAEEKEPEMVEE